MYQGDYSSAPYYNYSAPQNPNAAAAPPPAAAADHLPNPYASAPPFSTSYTPSDYYSSSYPPYPQNPDPVTPTAAPSYAPAPASAPISAPNSNPPAQLTQSPSFPPSYDSHGAYQAPFQQPPYYSPFDQHQAAPNYAAPAPPSNPSVVPGPNKNPSYPSMYSAPYGGVGSTAPVPPPVYESQYDNNSSKYDVGGGGGGYYDERYGNYGKSRSDSGMDLYGKRSDGGGMSMYDSGRDDGYGDGVYAYQGGKSDPYGSRGTAPNSKSSTLFDDYGRPVSFPSGKDSSSPSPAKIVRAVPKVEVQQDVQGGVQKFRVKLLAESGGQSTMDVLCQVGLDGIRMLDPSTNRTLRIYPLETVTRCDVTDSSTFAFWSKSSVDLEPKRIRLQSNSYTTNTILDTVTAATVQFKEMGGRIRPSESVKIPEQPTDRKKGLADWVSMIKPANEEKDHWIPDEAVTKCSSCGTDFGAFVRKHHCRNCGEIFCDKCTQGRIALTAEENAQQVRVCDRCMAEVTHRLSNAKEAASKPAGLHSHEDLAKKLQEEMERNRKSSSGSKPAAASSGKRMREVACPTCTVHLQVQVPSSGSETIECGVCQHPFLVSAH